MSSPAQKPGAAGAGSQPREVMPVSVLAESELGSEAQRERRKRILDATLAIASKGGYEAVQMRAVADRADVAVGTLYRYFPSKVHLLVSALGREFERIDAKTDRTTVVGGTPYQRLNGMVSKLNRAMQRNPLLTEAMTRAYVFADASAAGEVDHVEKIIDSMFARAMSDGEPTEDQYHIARVISDVWLSNLLAWLTRRQVTSASGWTSPSACYSGNRKTSVPSDGGTRARPLELLETVVVFVWRVVGCAAMCLPGCAPRSR